MGRSLSNTMVNLGIQSECDEALYQVRSRTLQVTDLFATFHGACAPKHQHCVRCATSYIDLLPPAAFTPSQNSAAYC